MSLIRKTLAKYGAKIPTAPSTGAKQAKPSEGNDSGAGVAPKVKAARGSKKSDNTKR